MATPLGLITPETPLIATMLRISLPSVASKPARSSGLSSAASYLSSADTIYTPPASRGGGRGIGPRSIGSKTRSGLRTNTGASPTPLPKGRIIDCSDKLPGLIYFICLKL